MSRNRQTQRPAEPQPGLRDAALRFLQRHGDAVFVGLVVCLATVVFLRMLDNEFYNDDFVWMRAAREDMTWVNVFSTRVIGFFRPFINLTYWISEHLTPGNKWVYNVTQVVLHGVNTLLVFGLLKRLFRDRLFAGASALLFLLSFSHLGAVMWISGRTTLIFTGFLLASLLVALQAPTRRRRLSSWGLFALSLASKEEAIVGPALLALLYWYRHASRQPSTDEPQRWSEDRNTLVGFVVLAAAYFVTRSLVLGTMTGSSWTPGAHGWGNLAGSVLAQFWPRLMLALLGRSVFPHPGDSAWWPEVLAVPVLAGYLVVARHFGRGREMIFLLTWMAVSVLPTVFFEFRFLSMGSVMHTRYYYLACIGSTAAMVLVLLGFYRAKGTRGALRLAMILVFAGICLEEVRLNWNFENRFTRGSDGFRMVVKTIIARLDEEPEPLKVVLGDSPYDRRYLGVALGLERPGLVVEPFDGDLESIRDRAPCLFFTRSPENPRQFAIFVLPAEPVEEGSPGEPRPE